MQRPSLYPFVIVLTLALLGGAPGCTLFRGGKAKPLATLPAQPALPGKPVQPGAAAQPQVATTKKPAKPQQPAAKPKRRSILAALTGRKKAPAEPSAPAAPAPQRTALAGFASQPAAPQPAPHRSAPPVQTPPPRTTAARKTPEPSRPAFNELPTLPTPVSSYPKSRYSSVSTGGRKFVALTFDDGPSPGNTARLLDMLRARGVRATFYVLGQRAASYPAMIRRIIGEGHEIGSHSYSHKDFRKLSDAQLRNDLRRTAAAIHSAGGSYPRTWRPPYGALLNRQRELIHKEFGYPSVYWSVDPLDWKKPGSSVVTSRLVNRAQPGGILLAHDIHPATVRAVPATLDRLLAKGYRFVTVSQLIAMGSGSSAPPPGGIYGGSPAAATPEPPAAADPPAMGVGTAADSADPAATTGA